jgi:hypothetical protein
MYKGKAKMATTAGHSGISIFFTFKSNIFILSIFGISEVSKFKKSKVYTAKSARC